MGVRPRGLVTTAQAMHDAGECSPRFASVARGKIAGGAGEKCRAEEFVPQLFTALSHFGLEQVQIDLWKSQAVILDVSKASKKLAEVQEIFVTADPTRVDATDPFEARTSLLPAWVAERNILVLGHVEESLLSEARWLFVRSCRFRFFEKGAGSVKQGPPGFEDLFVGATDVGRSGCRRIQSRKLHLVDVEVRHIVDLQRLT